MHNFKCSILTVILIFIVTAAFARMGEPPKERVVESERASLRADCALATQSIDQSINNVRARLLNGGDVWWDRSNGRYIVPKVDPGSGQEEVSSLYAGAVWLGGVDPAGNLKVGCQTYGSNTGNTDFWPGPLTETGTTEDVICAQWDKFFKVTGDEIREHLLRYDEAISAGGAYTAENIPKAVRVWPAFGNPYFFDEFEFDLPNAPQGLALFFDRSGDGIYDPTEGDYPIIDIRGCDDPQFPDEMVFWIYNDAGGTHTESQGDAIQMEVQVQSFAYRSNDEINNMTFQRYKLINRAVESIDSMFFAMWVDPDLGCAEDDYVGCDVGRSLAYIYNQDNLDGEGNSTDCGGVPTYGAQIPGVAVDYFRGPLDENGDEIGMSSFTYYNRGDIAPPGTEDPNIAIEFYRYLSGSWRDGTRFTQGGNAYNSGSVDYVNYAFIDRPNNSNGWSMCSEALSAGDRRTIQASGPFRLDPGAVNELIIGAVWVPELDYPCPDVLPLLAADDIAQALFDNCFDLLDGPDAPDVDWIELDKELIAIMTNHDRTSNNADEKYTEVDIYAPEDISNEDKTYEFEGYRIYQLIEPNVSVTDFDDPDKARLVANLDVANGITEIYNWIPEENPSRRFDPNVPEFIFRPVLRSSDASDSGIQHSFQITSDLFADADPRLVNHKKYYFSVVAYAYNNWKEFDQTDDLQGQPNPYLAGRNNIRTYTVIPRPIVDRNLNTVYGEGVPITRLDGRGAGNNFLNLTQESRDAAIDGSFNGELDYTPGLGPVDVQIVNPLEVVDGEYILQFTDRDKWFLYASGSTDTIFSDTTFDKYYEQIVPEYGFSVAVEQTEEPNIGIVNNGAIGASIEYLNPEGPQWLAGMPDNGAFQQGGIFNYAKTENGGVDAVLDPGEHLTRLSDNAYFMPFTLTDYRPNLASNAVITPALTDPVFDIVRSRAPIDSLNNVDIVLTSDKSKWSRSLVVETASQLYYGGSGVGGNITTVGNAQNFYLRKSTSVTQNGGSAGDFSAQPEADAMDMGMGWFPGYAIDVETGKRLNIFFGENSTYRSDNPNAAALERANGDNMIWDPTSQIIAPLTVNTIYPFVAGGQHFIYVTKQEYDECAELRTRIDDIPFRKVRALQQITWAGFPLLAEGASLNSYAEGLIPNDVVIKLRVTSPYGVVGGTGFNENRPAYRFTIDGKSASELTTMREVDDQLDAINVVPNPYYGYSQYEVNQFTTTVKITNLPSRCDVTIFSIDGKFIRNYKRDEQGTPQIGTRPNPGIRTAQITPALEWDMKNHKGIPIASGVYLIHVDAGELGERVIKWFGVNRQFDPSGL